MSSIDERSPLLTTRAPTADAETQPSNANAVISPTSKDSLDSLVSNTTTEATPLSAECWSSEGTIGAEAHEPALPTSAGRLAAYARALLIGLLVLMLLMLLSVLILTVASPLVAQHVLDQAELSMSRVTMSELSAQSVRLCGQLVILAKSGPLYAGTVQPTTLEVAVDVGDDVAAEGLAVRQPFIGSRTVVEKAQMQAPRLWTVGNITVPGLSLDTRGVSNVDIDTYLRVQNSSGMAELVRRMLERNHTSLYVHGTVAVALHGMRIDGLQLRKSIALEGLSRLNNVTLQEIDLPRDDPKGGISIRSVVDIYNPSSTTIFMPAMALETLYNDVQFSEMYAGELVLRPGANRLAFHGRLLPQHGNQTAIDGVSAFMSRYIAGNQTDLVVRGAQHVTNASIPWLDAAFRTYTVTATLPSSQPISLVSGIDQLGLDFNFTDTSRPYAPVADGTIALWMSKLKFGFNMNVRKIGMAVDFLSPAKEHPDPFARLHIPLSDVNMTDSNQSKRISYVVRGQPIVAHQGQEPAFERFLSDLVLTTSVPVTLQGNAVAYVDTAIGQIRLEQIPATLRARIPGKLILGSADSAIDIRSLLFAPQHATVIHNSNIYRHFSIPLVILVVIGMNGFRGAPAEIGGLSILGSDQHQLRLGMHVAIKNPTDLGCAINKLRLALAYDGAIIGSMLAEHIHLQSGVSTFQAQSIIPRPKDPLMQRLVSRFFSGYLSGNTLQVEARGQAHATDAVALLPAFRHLQLSSNVPGLTESLVRGASLHLFWSPSVVLALYNPIPGPTIYMMAVNSTVVHDDLILGTGNWTFSNDDKRMPPIQLPSHKVVATPRLPITISSKGYKVLKSVLGGSLLVDVDIAADLLIGAFPLRVEWRQRNVTVSVSWFL